MIDRFRRRELIVTLILLLVILAIAAYVRLWRLTPPEMGINYAPDTDEGAYAFSAQLMLQGNLPYQDFFATLPPAGLYLFSAVLGLFYHMWGSLEGFMALRYMSVVYGVATVLVTYFIGKEIGGRPAGLLAALVLAVDGVVIGQDRRAMLEAPMNLLSALAILVYVRAMLREKAGRWSMVWAGALSAAAVMVKSPGAVVPIVLVGMTVLRRRWRDLWALIAGGVVTGLILAGPFLVLCPGAFLKQVYVFQLVRPPDGVLSVEARLREIWSYPYSWLTMRLCWLGAAAALVMHWRRRTWAGWSLIALWAGGTLALIVASRSYWGTYFPQLAVPLAILAGGLLSGKVASPGGSSRRVLWQGATAVIWLLFLIWGVGFDHFGVQFRSTRVWLSFSKPAFGAVARYLEENSGPEDAVLATDPLYGMLASRALAHEDHWPYMADSYGSMLYASLGLRDAPWSQILRLKEQIDAEFAAHEDLATLQFHGVEAQADVLASFDAAQYVVIDRRARRQWAPATIAQIEANSTPVLTVDDVTLLEHVVH